jgi:hypothetical protein
MRKTILIVAICIQAICFGQVNYKYYSRTELEKDLETVLIFYKRILFKEVC